MHHITPYLHFDGNAAEAMGYYKTVFNSEFSIFQKFGDTPGAEKMPAEDREKAIHISLPVGNTVLMATDIIGAMQSTFHKGNNLHLCIHTDTEKEVDRLMDALSAGGQVEMPANKTMWGAYFGSCRDRFGVQWMISYDYNR